MTSAKPLRSFTLSCLAAFTFACTVDTSRPPQNKSDAGEELDDDVTPDADAGLSMCSEMGSICHDFDRSLDDIFSQCHRVGHEQDEAACAEIYDECMAACQGDAGAGHGHGHGHSDAGHPHDAGDDHHHGDAGHHQDAGDDHHPDDDVHHHDEDASVHHDAGGDDHHDAGHH